MNKILIVINLMLGAGWCRDFYLGMFRRNDFLVAQENVYKEASHFGYTTASYGRLFKCPITYFRVVDRLGMGRGPYTTVVRGGLKKKFIAVRIRSTYNLPISVNIYVGCENKAPSTIKRLTRATSHVQVTTEGEGGDGASDGGADGGTGGSGGSAAESEAGGDSEEEE